MTLTSPQLRALTILNARDPHGTMAEYFGVLMWGHESRQRQQPWRAGAYLAKLKKRGWVFEEVGSRLPLFHISAAGKEALNDNQDPKTTD